MLTQATGYTYIDTAQKMRDMAAAGITPLLGLSAPKNLTPGCLRPANTMQPRLPEMTAAALSVLERTMLDSSPMIEGSLVYSGNHEENLDYQFGEMDSRPRNWRIRGPRHGAEGW